MNCKDGGEIEQEQLDWKDDIGIERIDCEYKVFNFNPLKLSIDDGSKYLSSGIFSFNDSVEETLGNYINIYLPKYICSFFNPRSMLKKSNLYFGIDDDGKVIGIPYTGIIHENFINHMIDKVFSSHMKFPSTQIKDKIRQLVKVEIIPVSKTKIVSKQTNPNKKSIYSKYVGELDTIKKQNRIYRKNREGWNKMCDLDNIKLYYIINNIDTRKFIWKYMKIKTNYMKKKFTNKYSHLSQYCDVYSYWDLMADVKSNKEFSPMKIGSMFEVYENNLDIYKWIAVWKDSKFSMLKLAKPKKPKKKIDSYYPIFLLSQVHRMIPEWVKKNHGLNLYVIKFTFNTDGNWHELKYIDSENQWKTSYRKIEDGNPMSPSFNVSIDY